MAAHAPGQDADDKNVDRRRSGSDVIVPTIPRAIMRSSFAALTEDSISPLAATLAALYSFYIVVFFLQKSAAGSAAGMAINAVCVLLLTALWLTTRRWRIRPGLVGPAGAAIGLLAGLNSLLAELATHRPELSTHVILCVAALPLFLLDWRWLAGVIATLAAGWYVVQSIALAGTEWHNQIFAMVSAIVVSALFYSVRLRSHYRLEETRQALRASAVTDELTGLYNRRGFLETGELLLLECRRLGQPVVLLFLDVDGLKAVNDTAGHNAGDELLRAAADVLTATFRGTDIIGRLGGDEFAVVLPLPADVVTPIERLLDGVAHLEPVVMDVRLSLSVGDAYSPASTETLGQLLSRGDADMYRRRAAGSYPGRKLRLVPSQTG